MTRFVSVLIPAYNERYFGEAFASARAQTHEPLEIVVCDDSPGDAIERAALAEPDSRVRYLRNSPRLGFGANFTHCLREAKGELVKFLNDDDRLRPDCVATLAAAFDRHPGIRLATSRRQVIDAEGTARPDVPATQPVSFASCVIEGHELGNLALMNGLNLIGEPTTVMFRREDVPTSEEIFTWNGQAYRCLADLSVWLRLLAQGDAYYHAAPVSEYRVHPGQAQRAGDMGIDCITERFDLVHAARGAGFLASAMQYQVALTQIAALSTMWMRREGVTELDRERLRSLSTSVAGALA